MECKVALVAEDWRKKLLEESEKLALRLVLLGYVFTAI